MFGSVPLACMLNIFLVWNTLMCILQMAHLTDATGCCKFYICACVQGKTGDFKGKEIHQEIINKHKNVPRSFKLTNCCEWEDASSSSGLLEMRESKMRNSSEGGNVEAEVSLK